MHAIWTLTKKCMYLADHAVERAHSSLKPRTKHFISMESVVRASLSHFYLGYIFFIYTTSPNQRGNSAREKFLVFM